MKICPSCKAQFPDTETVCPDCWSHQALLGSSQTVPEIPASIPASLQTVPENPVTEDGNRGYFQFTIGFFNRIVNLLTIIGIIVTILTLFPVFVTFILGENWFNQLLADPNVGFLSLLLIWIATFFGAAFVYCLIALIIIDFINQIRRTQNLHISEIIFALAILSLVILSIGCIVPFLWLVWFTKFDLVVYFYGLHLLLLTMVPALIIIISGIIRIYSDYLDYPVFVDVKNSLNSCATNFINRVSNSRVITYISAFFNWLFSIIYRGRTILMIILLIILSVIVLYFFYLVIFQWLIPISKGISTINNETSKYYSKKEVIVKIHCDKMNQTNTTPIMLSLQRDVDLNSTKNWSGFDEGYSQCHWSTNFGYFITRSSDNSTITMHTRSLVIPRCLNNNDLVLWTYDLADYSITKPAVTIGLTLEDQNKILKVGGNGVLGKANLSISWSDFDKISNDC